eukprot:c10610_g1_i1.p1 GENE.c10610_g1_i1~~c10610_g1_i1.p1  ORF type:complete len:191 (+),score=50.30 c10610_g1_i1:181-753(+)
MKWSFLQNHKLTKKHKRPTAAQVSEKAREDIAKGKTVDVFLGGSCNPTTWRHEIAVPKLEALNITFYNPQVDEWSPELVALEAHFKTTAQVLLFVIDDATRAVASMVEAVEFITEKPDRIVVAVLDLDSNSKFDDTEDPPEPSEIKDLNRGRAYVRDVAKRRGVPVFGSIEEALDCVADRLHKTQPKENQ